MLPMLRFCNALKKRLSKLDTVFCGRILIFLACVTPLSDPSGVNRGSAFNITNKTEFEEEDADAAAEEKANKATEPNEDDKPEDTPVDFVFYRQFWSLQKFFCEPNLCYESKQWEAFTECTKAVLTHFNANKLDDVGVSVQPTIDSQEYFAKFLTSSRLFTLQLSDSQFRRQILVQLLVLFQYLTGVVKSKKKLELTTKQKEWISKINTDVDDLLKTTPPEGDKFFTSIKRIVDTEEHWVEWKNNNCLSYEKPVAVLEAKKRKRSRQGDDSSKKKNKVDLGNTELSRLWNLSKTNDDGSKSEARCFMPKPDKYFEEALMQLDPINDIEKCYWLIKDPDFCWRALRLLSQERLHYIQDLPSNTNSWKTLEDYLEHALKALQKEQQSEPGKEKDKKDSEKSEEEIAAALATAPKLVI